MPVHLETTGLLTLLGIWNVSWVDGLNLVGVAIGVIALGFTLWQVSRTRTIAEETRRVVTDTVGQLARDEKLILVADLHRTDRDLHGAVNGSMGAAVVADRLADWRDKGYGLWQLIRFDTTVDPDVRDDLLASSKLAAEVRSRLPATADEIREGTKTIRGRTSRVCGQLATLERQIRYETRHTNGPT